MERNEFALLESLSIFIEAKTIVEVGVQFGNMAIYLCRAAQKNGGRYLGFDLWNTHGLKNQFEVAGSKESVAQKLTAHGLTSFDLIQIDTINDREHFIQALTSICSEGIDLAFIDACHSYKGIASDFFSVYPLLTKTGVVIFHDTLRIDGCREFVLDLRTKFYDGTFDLIDLPFGTGDRRCGISILSKRSFPTLSIGIDEVCGSISDAKTIELNEYEWYKSEMIGKPLMPKEFRGSIRLEDIGYCSHRNKFE